VADGRVRSYKDLDAWRAGVRLVKSVYGISRSFPSDERFGLVSQVRRASVSVPSNIAEGWGRGSTQEYLRFLRMARASLFEVETQLIIAQELEFATSEQVNEVQQEASEAGRILTGLIKSIENRLRIDKP